MAVEREYTPEELAEFDKEVARLRSEELPRVREEEMKAAAQRAVERDVEAQRDVYRDELDDEVELASVELPAEERRAANRNVPEYIMLLLVVLLVLALIASAVTGKGIGSFFNFSTSRSAAPAATVAPLQPLLGGASNAASGAIGNPGGIAVGGRPASGDPNAGGVDGINSIVGPGNVTVDPQFWPFYSSHGGLPIFGLPLDVARTVNSRKVQWFERARLEYWPEHIGTENEVQAALLGSEFTAPRQFPTQEFFVSRPGLRFFPETAHGVGEPFLSFWEEHGGLPVFGYPISDVVQEELADGLVYNVQYFQRARMELHDKMADPAQRVMLGLLGRGLFLHDQNPDEATPKLLPPLQPTPVP